MKTISFYSYKGGVGRSLALAYTAGFLAQRNTGVCVLDIDLEAPGIIYKFPEYTEIAITKLGVLDYIHSCIMGDKAPDNIEDYFTTVYQQNEYGYIKVMSAGKDIDKDEYWKKLSALNWNDLFLEKNSEGLYIFENLKRQIEKQLNPDFLLIDSRSGVTKVGILSSSVLPDKAVMLLANNPENFLGSRIMYNHIANSADYRLDGRKIDIVCAITRIPTKEDTSVVLRKLVTLDTMREKQIVGNFLNYMDNPLLKESDISIIHSDREIEFDELSILKGGQRFSRRIVGDYAILFFKIIDKNDEELIETREAFVINPPLVKVFEYDVGEIAEKELKSLDGEPEEKKNSCYLLYKTALRERIEGKIIKAGLTLHDAIGCEDDGWKAKARYLRGIMFLYDFRNFNKSIEDLKFVHEYDGHFNTRIHYDLAFCYFCLDEYDKALEHVESYLSENVNDHRAFALRACANFDNLFSEGKSKNLTDSEKDNIISDFNKAIEISPSEHFYNIIGSFYFRIGDYEEAIVNFDKAIDLIPHFDLLFVNRGMCYFALGKNEEALADYQKALELNPGSYYAYNNRGLLYDKLGEIKKARNDFNKAIEIDPNYENALANREGLYKKMGSTDDFSDSYYNALETNLMYDNIFYNPGDILKVFTFPIAALTDTIYFNVTLIKSGDKFFVSDRGTTLRTLSELYNLNDPAVTKNIAAVLKELKIRKNGADLIIEINNENQNEKENKELFDAMIRMFCCFSFLKNMLMFYDKQEEEHEGYRFALPAGEIKSEKDYQIIEKYHYEIRYYMDNEEYEFALIRKNGKIFVSDQGKTYRALDKIYELSEKDVQKNLSAIMCLFQVLQDEDEFVIEIKIWDENPKVEKNEEINMAANRMLECVSFMDTMHIFFV